jgi:hypothetical protein
MFETQEQIDRLLEGRASKDLRFPNILPRGRADELLGQLRKERDDAREGAKEALNALGTSDQGFLYGASEYLKNFSLGNIIDRIAGKDVDGQRQRDQAEAARKSAEQKYAVPLKRYRDAQQAVIDREKELEQADQQAFFVNAYNNISSKINPFGVPTDLSGLGYALGGRAQQGAGLLGSLIGDVTNPLNKALGFVENAVLGGATRNSLLARRAALEKELAEKPPNEKAGNLSAFNARFLTRGPGASQEVIEQKKTTAEIQKMREDLQETNRLLAKFGPVGVIDKN